MGGKNTDNSLQILTVTYTFITVHKITRDNSPNQHGQFQHYSANGTAGPAGLTKPAQRLRIDDSAMIEWLCYELWFWIESTISCLERSHSSVQKLHQQSEAFQTADPPTPPLRQKTKKCYHDIKVATLASAWDGTLYFWLWLVYFLFSQNSCFMKQSLWPPIIPDSCNSFGNLVMDVATHTQHPTASGHTLAIQPHRLASAAL